MSEEAATDPKFEIGHVLFIDIVGYSKLLIGEQSELIRQLKEVVAGSEQVRLAEEQGKLVSLPTGDGVALVFRDSAEAPAQCGLEIAQAVNRYPQLRLRIGIHSGPVNMVTDVNNRANVAGAGINIAQRVMDCGDAGHILLSKHVAEDLEHYARWRPYLHELGECEVKHRARISLVNFYGSNFGNAEIPEKIRQAKREQARASRDRRKSILVATSIVAAAMLGIGYWVFHQRRANAFGASETNQAIATISEQMARLHEGIMQYMQIEGKIREAQTESGSVRDQVYEQLGKQMNIDVALLRQKLPQAAEQLKNAPSATLFERASAAYVANDYQEAERLALQAAVQIRNATPAKNADVIRALKLAGFAAQKRIEYATAMEHLRETAELTNRERDPGQWAEIQHAIADVLIDQGQYGQAATVLEGAVEARNSAFGREHPDTLRSRNRLAYALWRQGRYKEAEEQFRQLVAVEERVLGSHDPETLASENGLANALDDEGKHGDAESEHRLVLEARIKVLGPENPETLKSRNNLALALNRQQKYAEAEKQFRELITAEERVLGPEHPETLRSRRNLFVTLGNQGKHAEAEAGFRDLLIAEERVLGPEHPDTLGVRNNIGHALAQQERFAEAESQFREVIKTESKVPGPEHPATLSSRMAFAGVLSQQEKYAEADAECREAIALEEKVLGTEHPSTISSWYAFAYQLARQNKTEEALQFARKAASVAEQVFGQDHPNTRKYAELVQQLESQRPDADQASVKAVKAGVHEYIAAEARKHIGETATIVGTVDDIGQGRRHVDLVIGGRDLSKAQLWIVVRNDAAGPELDPEQLRHVTIAVTGKLESSGGTPQITVKSTTQIQPRSTPQTNYIGRAYDKEQKGEIDAAMADLEQAIQHQAERRDEACEHLARIKEKRGDWTGALATYDRLVSLDSNKAGSYYHRATAKKEHGDFEGAMADFTRAAELRSSGISFVEIGKMRKANGDASGAMAEYDKAIAMLDGQIAGRQKPSDGLDLLYYQRGYTKELKGDLDGAISDYNQAIAIKPSYSANAFSRRGDIKKTRGDLAGAIADYESAVKYAQLPEDNEKLKKARAEVKTRAKNVATQPNIQATQNEESFNKSEVTPESIAKAFVKAYSGADIEALGSLYADRVDYTNNGVISNAAIRKQAQEYFVRWPVRQWSLAGPVKTTSMRSSRQKVIFAASYDTSNPQTNKHASGIATETLILVSDASGATKIVSQKEETSKRSNGQSGESSKQISEDATFEAATADSASDAPMKQKLLGYWHSGRHAYLFKSDGICYMVEGTTTSHWDIRSGVYYYDGIPCKIVSLSEKEFEFRSLDNASHYIEDRWERCSKKDIEQLKKCCSDWMKEHEFADPAAEPKTAEIVDIPAKFADSRFPPGNVKITFTDGHTETLTHKGNCTKPRVLAGGIVGWVHFTALDQRGYALNDTLQLRFPDGRTKEFKPNHEAPFIQDWGLADHGSSIVIESMQHHGHPYFIRYDLKSGRITGTVNTYLPYDKLPPWAQPLSDEKP